MYIDQESIFYYLTVMNEQYAMPPMPEGAHDGILKGLYRFSGTTKPDAKARAQLFGSGAILPEVIKAAGDPRGQVRRRRRCLERHQLQRAVPRRPRVRALEHAASRRGAAGAVRDAVPEGRARRVRRGVRLREGAARFDRQVAAAPARRARHRRLRPQREPRQPARVLRSRLPLRRRRDAERAGARRQGRRRRSSSRRSRRTTSIRRKPIPRYRDNARLTTKGSTTGTQ